MVAAKILTSVEAYQSYVKRHCRNGIRVYISNVGLYLGFDAPCICSLPLLLRCLVLFWFWFCMATESFRVLIKLSLSNKKYFAELKCLFQRRGFHDGCPPVDTAGARCRPAVHDVRRFRAVCARRGRSDRVPGASERVPQSR